MSDIDTLLPKLEALAEKLLNIDKRNNLINFKDTKSSTIEILFPEAEKLFEKISEGKKLKIFDPGYDEYYEEDNPGNGNTLQEEGSLEVEGHPKKATRKEAYLGQYRSKVKEGELLVYNEKTPRSSFLIAKKISKKAREYIEETGVNVAYIAFGFVHWRDNSEEFQAPLLLAPISIKMEWGQEYDQKAVYYIEPTGDDILVNPAFAYRLEKEHEIKLPDYEGDKKLDEYLELVRGGPIVSKLNWEVSTECKVGLFSFLKISMYRDIEDNTEAILKDPNIRQMLGEHAEKESDSSKVEQGQETKEDYDPLINLHNIVDADSSQIKAIEMAKSGKSFVLQGPPGTGKSQTITNIIAECLSDNKKVLFVSEKLAALNVVYDKLKKARLSDFCLELHSHKGNKKEVIAELYRTLSAGTSTLSASANDEIETKKRAKKRLDEYEQQLHRPRPDIGKSLYELYESYSRLRKTPDIVWDAPGLETKDDIFLNDRVGLLEQYVGFIPMIGNNYKENPWYGYVNRDTSYQARNAVKTNLEAVQALSGGLSPVLREISEKYQISNCDSISDALVLRDFFKLVSESKFITPTMLRKERLASIDNALKDLQKLSEQILAEKSAIDEAYDENIYKINNAEYREKLTKQYSGASRFFHPEYWKLMGELRLCKKGRKRVKYKEALATVERLGTYRKLSSEFENVEVPVKGTFGEAYVGINTDWSYAFEQINALREITKKEIAFGKLKDCTDFSSESANMVSFANRINQCFTLCDTEVLRKSGEYFDRTILDIWRKNTSSVQDRCKNCLDNIGILNTWCRFRDLLTRIEEKQMTSFLDVVIENNIEKEQIVNAFKKRLYFLWSDRIRYDLEFNRSLQDDAIRTFSEKDVEQFEINKTKIRERLSSKRPSLTMIAPGGGAAVLLRENQKRRKQKPIRVLLAETGEFVQTIKPCFLMSPLSVSTFLAKTNVHFDVVIFDEASQVFPQDAIGSIYRAKQLIVVGDSRQMPPSNFFNTTASADDEDDEEDITDFESILDLCSAFMEQLYLEWHYRSRYESLIAFSNQNFYQGRLITFPSAKVNTQWIGVDYYHVDGAFTGPATRRTNKEEAKRVVDLIYENIERYPKRSLGVVAFSKAQQSLIDDLLSQRRQMEPEKEEFFDPDAKEPFFIKNLETVQGDERDTIIFSTSYGKNEQGQMLHKFGPLNSAGGERRLNVAVTRAKHNVQVVSSMHATDIDLDRISSKGAVLLREYLDFAENGEIALKRAINVDSKKQYDSPFEEEVYEFLSGAGYSVDTQVGCSGYRIDLGLKRPNSSDYVLAIECDGATYHSSKNARDRDRLRQEILEGMGWKFHRIWSTNWFQNKKEEQEILINAVEEALTAPPTEDIDERDLTGSFETVEAKKKFEFPRYEEANIRELEGRYRRDIKGLVKAVLEVEAPLSEEFFMKRYYEGTSQLLHMHFRGLMRGCEAYGIIMRNGFMYLKGAKVQFRVPGDIPREIKYIAPEELADGMEKIVEQNVVVDKEGLYRALAQQCGVRRIGRAIREQFDRASKILERKGIVIR